ncbi:unnamed protein product, partial [Polarella glacialis]
VQQLRDAGQEYGLTYRYGPEDLVSGTTDSHRLMRYIGTDSGMEGVFAYRRHLMRAFNEEGKALSDWKLLLEAAGK